MNDIRIDTLRLALADNDPRRIAAVISQLHPSDLVRLARHLDDEETARLIDTLPPALRSETFSRLSALEAARLLDSFSAHHSTSVLSSLDPDEATDVLAEMESGSVQRALQAMDPPEAEVLRRLLEYPEGTAGALMTPEFIAISRDVTASQAIDAIRAIAREVEVITYLYVIDDGKLAGVLSLRSLVLARPDTEIRLLMTSPVISVNVDSEESVAIALLRNWRLSAFSVIDDDGHLLGVISAEDAMNVMEQDFSDELLKMAGTNAEEMEHRTPLQIARLRLPWLLGTMVLELLAGLVIHNFDDVLQRVILLASFMTVISAISGNVGLQSAAIVVRGLDTGHVMMSEWKHHVRKELATTSLLAGSCGVVLGTIGMIWAHHVAFGIVIGAALSCSMLTAGALGTLIPMVSSRLGFDPATTAGPFETAFQDIVGFGVFLWLASLLVNVIT